MDKEDFLQIYSAVQKQYPNGVVVEDGGKLYGFRRSPKGRLTMVHPALAHLLKRGLPSVMLVDLLSREDA